MSDMVAIPSLSSLDLFKDVPASAIQSLSSSVSVRVFEPGNDLMSVDHGSDAAYLILQGTVKVHVEEADGTEVLLAILGPGELLGEVSLLDGRTPSATVTALDHTECLAMNFSAFREAIRTVPLLAYNFARTLAARLRLSNNQIQALASLNVENRVARQIMAFADRYGQPQPGGAIQIPIRLTQSDLSHIIGASREQTNRVLVSYRNRGFLSVDANLRMTVHKPDLLSRLAMVR